MNTQQQSQLKGTLYAVSAFALWGATPIYWKALHQVPPAVILGQRMIWTFLFALVWVLLRGHLRLLRAAFADRRHRTAIILCAITLTSNWFLYLYAVASNHLIEASLGYYINPLLSVLFGVLFLKERLRFWQLVALLVAAAAVGILTAAYGRFPWISILIAFSFGLYGLIKKASGIDSRISITAESMFLTPFAAVFLVAANLRSGIFYLGLNPLVTLLIVCTGIVTALPLLWFAKAAENIPLSRVGFAQYLTPTSFLLLGVLAYHEPFSRVQLVSFICIWTALALFSLSGTPLLRRFTPRRFRRPTGKPER